MELPSRGGAEGTGGSYRGPRDREAGPSPHRRCLHVFRPLRLTLGSVHYDVETGDDKRPRVEQREEVAREDLVDPRRRRSQGRLRGAIGGFLPAVSVTGNLPQLNDPTMINVWTKVMVMPLLQYSQQ